MGAADLPRWAWVAVGLLVGLTHGAVREWSAVVDPLDDYGLLMTDQRQFEEALVAESHGHRHFKDIVVYPHWTRGPSSGRETLVHLVTGAYWNGRTEMKDGAVVARWEPACYVAPVPYRPLSAGPQESATPAAPRRTETSPGSVLDYLAQQRDAAGVESRYAWWWWARRSPFTSSLAGLLLIGGAFPSVLSLIAHGSLLPPPRAKRPSLWRVRSSWRRHSPDLPTATATGAHELGSALEVTPTGPDAEARVVADPPSRPLPLAEEVQVAELPGPEKHFGARGDDFYPTVLRASADES